MTPSLVWPSRSALTLGAAVSLLLSACVASEVHFVPLVNPQPPMVAIPGAQVEVLAELPRQRPYINVGLVESVINQNRDGDAGLLRILREDAGRLGCNAVLVTSIVHGRINLLPSIEGNCIVYTETPPNSQGQSKN